MRERGGGGPRFEGGLGRRGSPVQFSRKPKTVVPHSSVSHETGEPNLKREMEILFRKNCGPKIILETQNRAILRGE